MKHLKSYKIFESNDAYFDKLKKAYEKEYAHLLSLEDMTRDILTELSDGDYSVEIQVRDKDYSEKSTGAALSIKIEGSRKESLYSRWKQDRENYAKREYDKNKEVLERLHEVLKESGLRISSINNYRYTERPTWGTDEGYALAYGQVKNGYDFTGHWLYHIIYVVEKL